MTSFARFLGDDFSCDDCTIEFPRNGRVFDLGRDYDTFRIGWGEGGGQDEGFFPWRSGTIRLR